MGQSDSEGDGKKKCGIAKRLRGSMLDTGKTMSCMTIHRLMEMG